MSKKPTHMAPPKQNNTVTKNIDKALVICLIFSIIFFAALGVSDISNRGEKLVDVMSNSVYKWHFISVINIILIEMSTAGMILMSIYILKRNILQARYMTRVLVVLIILTALMCVIINGFTPMLAAYVIQLIIVVTYQVNHDPNLYEHPKTHDTTIETKSQYMSLNVFNLFWVFVIGSIAGLVIESIYHIAVYHEWQDRAGLLWGPFSPIYGTGAVCLTVALNRWWKSPIWKIFLVGGVVGSIVEYITSWYLEATIGVVAWNYTGTLGSINGRTNLAFFLIWGTLGLLWVKTLLPLTMKIVNLIPLHARAFLTATMFAFLLIDQCMTLITCDCWSRRNEGQEPITQVEIWCAKHFDDQHMESRFQSMSFKETPVHIQIEEATGKTYKLSIGDIHLL